MECVGCRGGRCWRLEQAKPIREKESMIAIGGMENGVGNRAKGKGGSFLQFLLKDLHTN